MIEINESDPRQPKLQQYFNLYGNFFLLYYMKLNKNNIIILNLFICVTHLLVVYFY